VAVLPDFHEEGWPSMDRVADELLRGLARHGERLTATVVRPAFRRRAAVAGAGGLAVKIDRALNRFIDYPRHLSRAVRGHDIFHVVDHSYAQLVHRLPSARTVVTCHDLDAFRSLLHPGDEPRSWAFRAMTRHVLEGLRRAACVTCDTAAVRDELVRDVRVRPDRAIVVPVGVSRVFSPEPDEPAARSAERLLGPRDTTIEILHVGGVAPRKRIDILLASVAGVRRRAPNLRLVHVGDPFTRDQDGLAGELGLGDAVVTLTALDDEVLAAIYRRAALVLVPSEREGFGLPVAESLASGTPVVASDLPVLREVGGSAAAFCPVGDASAWIAAVTALLEERSGRPERWADRRRQGALWATRYSWVRFADQCAAIYDDLARAAAVGRAEGAACPA
jgi:glycosyltransferase involved in cell wall biosynthesis